MESSVVRRLSLRELMVLARERLGARAAELKTRDELVAALFGAPGPASPAPAPVAAASPSPAPAPPAAAAAAPEAAGPRVVVTRDFFVPSSR